MSTMEIRFTKSRSAKIRIASVYCLAAIFFVVIGLEMTESYYSNKIEKNQAIYINDTEYRCQKEVSHE